MKYDFGGWATKNDLLCSDGRVIQRDAFKHCDGKQVPLVWNHQHNQPTNILGYAVLNNRPDGVYTYGSFNDTEDGQAAKTAVAHGDIVSLSIFANHLKHSNRNVVYGDIKEVSLVLSGANPGAFIDDVLCHSGESTTDEAVIYTGEELSHSEPTSLKDVDLDNFNPEDYPLGELANPESLALPKTNDVFKTIDDAIKDENISHSDTEGGSSDPQTLADVYNAMTDIQKNVVVELVAQALETQLTDDSEGGDTMKHNAFDGQQSTSNDTLTHADISAIFADGPRYGSLKDAVLAHGIINIDYLFPDAKTLNATPEFIKRDTGWVSRFMNGVHKTPFSRIKSVFANITENDARARGYIKGNLKVEEVFALLKRTTTPTTIYKKQKLDRDDIIDITDLDVVGFIKAEMRLMLDEEIARAALVGDGRSAASDDKINEQNIRPIWTDSSLYTVNTQFAVTASTTSDQRAKAFIRAAIKSRKSYKGSGNPEMYASEDVITDCLLLEDANGRVIYETIDKLKTALRVSDIISVPVMEGLTRTVSNKTHTLMAIYLNPSDYNIGADKGGAINMFDDFDIDYNKYLYLIETRCSGALVKPYSAVAIEAVLGE